MKHAHPSEHVKYKNQNRYEKRQRDERKLVSVRVWIPAEARERVFELAAKLRKLAKKTSGDPTP